VDKTRIEITHRRSESGEISEKRKTSASENGLYTDLLEESGFFAMIPAAEALQKPVAHI